MPSGCRPSQMREKYPPKYTINATIKMLVMDSLWLVSHYYFSTWLFDSPPQVCCLPDKQLGFEGWKAFSFFSDTYCFRRYFVWWICRSTRNSQKEFRLIALHLPTREYLHIIKSMNMYLLTWNIIFSYIIQEKNSGMKIYHAPEFDPPFAFPSARSKWFRTRKIPSGCFLRVHVVVRHLEG